MRSHFFMFLVLFLVSSCQNNNDIGKVFEGVDPDAPVDSLKNEISRNGSVESYERLCRKYYNDEPERMLTWSFIMANKYHNTRACIDIFTIFNNQYNKSADSYHLDSMDDATRKMILMYLKSAKDRNDEEANGLWDGVIRDNPDLGYLKVEDSINELSEHITIKQ